MKQLSKITESIWSDIQDRSSGDVVRKEDYGKVELINEFVKRHGFQKGDYTINKDLSLDIHRNISVREDDLIESKLPFKFGKIKGTMWLSNDLRLTTLENSPKEVTGCFVVYENNLKNFIGGPEIVGENFSANFNRDLETLDGSPKKVGGNYSIVWCTGVKDISGISPEIGGNLEVSKDSHIRFSGKTFTDEEYRQYSNIKGIIKRI